MRVSRSYEVRLAWPSAPPGLEAVIFDLGGTLIDYLGGAPKWPEMEFPGIQALHDTLSAAGFSLDADVFRDNFIAAMDQRWRAATAGNGDPPTLIGLIADLALAAEFHLDQDLHQAAAASYWGPIAERAEVRENARDVLHWLKRHGIRTGLISNSLWPAHAHHLDLERYGLFELLDHTLFSSETGLWKPDPRIFETSLAALNTSADRAVFVGDRLAEDIHGAHRAGLRSVLLEGTQDYSDLDPTDFHPDATIRRLAELPGSLIAMFGE